jgi:type II secretory pathway pseudopilin PulG
VIVVIGILAVITLVAYNGVQTRGENSKTVNVVVAYAKALSLYAVDNGSYPSTAQYPCLGSYTGTTGCARLVTGTPGCGFSGTAPRDATFDSEIAPYLGAKPSGSDQRVRCNGDEYVGAYLNATSANPKVARILYYLSGNQQCTAPGSTRLVARNQVDATTLCSIELPTL